MATETASTDGIHGTVARRGPDVFRWLADAGKVETEEMYRTFNMGIGLVLAVAPDVADETLTELAALGEQARLIGMLEAT